MKPLMTFEEHQHVAAKLNEINHEVSELALLIGERYHDMKKYRKLMDASLALHELRDMLDMSLQAEHRERRDENGDSIGGSLDFYYHQKYVDSLVIE